MAGTVRSPTGQWWQYPLAAPTYRFTQINNFVRGLDLRFDALSGLTKQQWHDWARRFPWNARCVPWIFDFDPTDSSGVTGIAAYRAVNAQALLQGLTVTDTPPIGVPLPGGDAFISNLPSDFSVDWVRPGGDPGVPCWIDVRAVALMHEPESGPALQKFKYGFGSPLAYSTPFELSPVFDALPGLQGAPTFVLALSVSGLGSAAFFGVRMVVQNPV